MPWSSSYRSIFAAVSLTSLGLAAYGAQQTVTWDDNSDDEDGFRVERAIDGNTFVEIATVPANVTSYVDRDVSLGTIYWYRIKAYKATAESNYSNLAGVRAASDVNASGSSTSKLINISARAIPGTGEQSLIVGFVVQNGNCPVLLRAVGPGLAAYTTALTVQDPVLEVLDGKSVIGQNDNWGGTDRLSSTFNQLGAFAIPAASRDAALLADFAPRGYTVLLTGANAGLAMAEIYDADLTGASPGRLMNLSVRAQTGTGDGVLIVGFVIAGNKSVRVLIRAIGPSLALYGVAGVLVDPQLDLFRGNVLLDHNDDWRGTASLASTFEQAGAFQLSDRTSWDAALTAYLPPGAYTAVISGVGGQTGVALAEIYELP